MKSFEEFSAEAIKNNPIVFWGKSKDELIEYLLGYHENLCLKKQGHIYFLLENREIKE